jgi:hypothetical protein
VTCLRGAAPAALQRRYDLFQMLHLGADCPQFLPYLGEALMSLRLLHALQQYSPRALKRSLAFSHRGFPPELHNENPELPSRVPGIELMELWRD